MLDDFAASEERRRTLRRWLINIARGSFTVGISASLWAANKLPPLHRWHIAVWTAAACLLAVSGYAFRTEVGDHFGTPERRAARSAADKDASQRA